MKRLKYPILVLFLMTMTSCATMFNSKKISFSIVTNEPSSLIVDGDTLKYKNTKKTVTVKRSKKPLPVIAYNDSLLKSIKVKPTVSSTTFLNLYFSWLSWVGVIVDLKTKKGYSYPSTVYIDLRDTGSTYLKYIPLPSPYCNFKNRIKITPLKLIGLINPGLEVCFERRTGKFFSTQLMASYLLPMNALEIGSGFNPNIKGLRTSIEEKLYLRKSAAMGPYVSLEFNYLKNQYHSVWNFGERDIYSDSTYNFTNYPDTFGIKKQTFSYNFKFGYQFIIKRLAIDCFVGLGAKYKIVSHFDRINSNDEMEETRHPNIYYATNLEGRYWSVSIPLNVRFGWTF